MYSLLKFKFSKFLIFYNKNFMSSINKMNMFMSYLLILMLFFNFNSIIMFWILMEINLTMFILILIEKLNLKTFNMAFFYFTIQCMSSIMFLISNIFVNYFYIQTIELIFIISMMLKMGMIPFHFWIFKMSNYLNFKNLFLILTLQKLPILFMFFNFNSNFTLFILILNLIMGSIMLTYSTSLSNILISSSLYSSIWMFIFILNSFLSFIMFFLTYMNYLFILCMNKEKHLFNLTGLEKFIFITSLMFFMGIPPMNLFFFKFYMMTFLTENCINLFLITMMFSFLSVMGYFNFFYKQIFETKNIYIVESYKKTMIFILFIINMMFLFFN